MSIRRGDGTTGSQRAQIVAVRTQEGERQQAQPPVAAGRNPTPELAAHAAAGTDVPPAAASFGDVN